MNAIKKYQIKDWDTAEVLTSEELIQGYLVETLQASIDDNTPELFTNALRDVARAKGMHNLAKETGLDRSGLYKALRPGSKPQFSTIIKISHAMKLDLSAIMI
ncbi:addiction module antidote protein [Avibacterium paragallinarum]|uniref:Transcriptional regulator n=1 Tax=Avibacterium paragallinarum TaxID=728 RepID=A0A377I7H2_AVIPA|nr:addiction module antidote protein [Avibacterium paragallinarum]POY45595.1 putative addiction module antidote protein [Avibacterium paragallinarum]RZN57722.1 putative addiction module antidote protein [Avibacterium paragallinarum]RZN76115.1 putative addiction module antidote protein [Avibacterium paragallinarum]TID28691.1 hypothetical protein JO83_02205 [Avibacterium paragallinarum]STO70752.1 transcriptional regulator [Avibacterium paragallinarum]